MFALCSPGCCAGAGTVLEVDDVDDGVVEPLVPGLQAAVAGPVLQLKTKVHTKIRNHGECPFTFKTLLRHYAKRTLKCESTK